MVLTSISGLSPAYGPTTGGNTVSVSGSGFTGATAVYFGTALYGNMDVVNDNLIYVYNPPHAAGVVDVTVDAPGGTSPITSADQFTYTAPPPASTSTYLSLSANPATFGQALTLTATVSHSGYGPTPTGMVEFEDGSTVLATEYLSGAAATLQTSTLAIGAHSLSAVYLGDTANAGSNSAPQSLTVNAAVVPAVTAVSPNSGPTAGGYSLVQISGSGFTGASGVSFGGAGVGMFSVMNDGLIDVYGLPAHAAGVVDVTVTTANGTSSVNAGDHYTYVAPLTLTNPGSQTDVVGDDVVLPINATDANGGTLTFSAAGLPGGITIEPNTGLIYGAVGIGADAVSPYNVTVTATDGLNSASVSFQWTISHFSLSNPGDQNSAAGDSAIIQMTAVDADGDPVTFSASSLPPGLTINQASGTISGVISDAAVTDSPYYVTVTASDGAASTSQSFNWTVNPVGVTNPGDQFDYDGDTLSLPITGHSATGQALTFSATGLPGGLNIDSESGVISGTIIGAADQSAPFLVGVSASDGTTQATQWFSWYVSPQPELSLDAPGDQVNAAGDFVQLQLSSVDAAGATPSYSASGLPDGLSVAPSTGIISGIVADDAPSGAPYVVTATVFDGTASASQTFQWTINYLGVTSPGDQSSFYNDGVSLQIGAHDATDAPLSFSASGLPDGLTIYAATGLISGTVEATANTEDPYVTTVTASDGNFTASLTFQWTINGDRSLWIEAPGDQINAKGDTVSLAIMAQSEGQAVSVDYAANGLPEGLTINPATGVIGGTITAAAHGLYSVAVTAFTGTSQASRAFRWSVANKDVDAEIPFTHTYSKMGVIQKVPTKGELVVESGVEYQGVADAIVMTFYYPNDLLGPSPKVGFLQFTGHENTNLKGAVEHHKKGDPVDNGNTTFKVRDQNKIGFLGDKLGVDTLSTNLAQPWYDAGTGAPREKGQEKGGDMRDYLRIWDSPSDLNPDTTKYKKSAGVFDTYLVINGQAIYHVTWRKEQVVEDGTWKSSEYKDVKGGVMTPDMLPDYAKADQLFAGYKLNDDGTAGDEILYKNPLLK